MPGGLPPGTQLGARTATNTGDFFQTVYDTLQADFANESPDQVKAAALKILFLVTGTSALISLLPFESNFGAYAAGGIISQAMSPFVRRIITDPVDNWLNKAFRYSPIPVRTAVSMLDDGIISADAFTDIAIDSGIKDKYMPLLRQYADFKRKTLVLTLKQSVDTKLDERASLQRTQDLADATAALHTAEAVIDAAELEVVRQQIANEIEPIARLASSIESKADAATITTGKAFDRAIGQLRSLLVESALVG